MMRLLLSTMFVLAALAAMPAGVGPAEAKDPTGRFVAVLDPAHGGKDEGVQLTRKVLEKDVTLTIATLVKRNLDDAKNLTVRSTRTDDSDVAMTDRVGTAIKAQADLFISLHVNAGFEKEAAGYELYFPGFEGQQAARGPSRGESAAIVRDMVRTKHLNEGVRFAQMLQKRLDPVFPRMDRGLREAPVPVLQNLSIPAVVLEIGFSTNPNDRKKLQEESIQAAVAKAIAESIREFFQ